ncbi:glycosyltransferase [Neorhodopirellula pilleata]|nr:glycosyltransferase [Neorhodopirellula pilleata]
MFQLHQARILRELGYQVGVISIAQQYSIPMLVKAIVLRAFGRQHSRVEDSSLPNLIRLFWNKMFQLQRFVREDMIDGLPVIRIDGFYYWPPHPARNHVGWIKAGLIAFERYRQQYGLPDLVHAHNCDAAGLLAREIKVKHGIPYVITEHSSYLHRGLIPPSLYPALSNSIRDADAMLVVSPTLKSTMKAKLGDVADIAEYLPNVIDPQIESISLAVNQPSPPPIKFLAIGDLIPLKGHANLISAFAKAFHKSTDAILAIAGDGPEQENLKRLIQEFGLNQQVTLLGRISRDLVISELDSCHCLVLPSQFETFGVVLIEALSRGKPVIATQCGGPQSVVTDQAGILVPVNDVTALAKALNQIHSELDRFDSVVIRESVIDRFGKKAFSASIEEVYQRVFQKKQLPTHA